MRSKIFVGAVVGISIVVIAVSVLLIISLSGTVRAIEVRSGWAVAETPNVAPIKVTVTATTSTRKGGNNGGDKKTSNPLEWLQVWGVLLGDFFTNMFVISTVAALIAAWAAVTVAKIQAPSDKKTKVVRASSDKKVKKRDASVQKVHNREWEGQIRDYEIALRGELQSALAQSPGLVALDAYAATVRIIKHNEAVSLTQHSETVPSTRLEQVLDPVMLIHREQRKLEHHYRQTMTGEISLAQQEKVPWMLVDELLNHLIKCIDTPTTPTQCLRIQAPPKAGKTTLLKYIAWLALKPLTGNTRPAFPIPFYLGVEAGKAFHDYIKASVPDPQSVTLNDTCLRNFFYEFLGQQILDASQTTDKPGKKEMARDIAEHIKKGHVLLLLDEFLDFFADKDVFTEKDAFTAKDIYRHMVNAINGVPIEESDRKSKVRVVVTYSQTPLQEYTEHTVLGMAGDLLQLCPQNIDLVVERWFKEKQCLQPGSNLVRKLHLYPRIQALAAHPQLLMYIAEKFEENTSNLHYRRNADLYNQCLERLLTKSNDPQRIQNQIALLSKIGWYLHSRRIRSFEYTSNPEALPDEMLPANVTKQSKKGWKKQWHTYLDELINKSGLFVLIRKDSVKEVFEYKFQCIALQEYCAAYYYVYARPEERTNLVGWDPLAKWNEPWWEEVVLLCVSLEKSGALLQQFLGQHFGLPAFSLTSPPEDLNKLLFQARLIGLQRPEAMPGSKVYKDIEKELLKIIIGVDCFYVQEHVVRIWRELDSPMVNCQNLRDLGIEAANNMVKVLNSNKVAQVAFPLIPLLVHVKVSEIHEIFRQLTASNHHGQRRRSIRKLWRQWDRRDQSVSITKRSQKQQVLSPEERVYIAHVIRLLGIWDWEQEWALADGLLRRLEKEEDDAGVSWAIAHSIAIFDNHLSRLSEHLLKAVLRNTTPRKPYTPWHMLNILIAFAALGHYAITERLHRMLKELPSSKYTDDGRTIWYARILLGAFDMEEMSEVTENIGLEFPNVRSWMEHELLDPDVVREKFELLMKQKLSIEEGLYLLDVVACLANTPEVVANLKSLLERLPSDPVQRMLYRSRAYEAWRVVQRRI